MLEHVAIILNFSIITPWSELIVRINLDLYLVGFWICAETLGLLKNNRLEKLVFP